MTLEVRPLEPGDLEKVLPLIAGYQRFYRAEPDDEQNRFFFARFLEPGDDGLLLGAWVEGSLAGFATIYWTLSSTRAAEVALLNDLFVAGPARGRGVGRALIQAAVTAARDRGAAHLEWYTATDNEAAQRLYDRFPGAARSAWLAYEVDLGAEEGGEVS